LSERETWESFHEFGLLSMFGFACPINFEKDLGSSSVVQSHGLSNAHQLCQNDCHACSFLHEYDQSIAAFTASWNCEANQQFSLVRHFDLELRMITSFSSALPSELTGRVRPARESQNCLIDASRPLQLLFQSTSEPKRKNR
jgi:hypothetical protein